MTQGGAHCRFEWLMGAPAFWARVDRDLRSAKRRALAQAMTFEGDAAGQAMATSIVASGAADRRVLVDDYTRVCVNDRWRLSLAALLDRELQREGHETRAMFARLVTLGVRVRRTNPIDGRPLRFIARNHKKLIVADDVAYIGGINFADHNFAWRDFMLRIEGAAEADFLAADFDATWAGRPRAQRREFPGLKLHALDGRTNVVGFAAVFSLIENACQTVTVLTPYLTFPFSTALKKARARGVRVHLITPEANNKPTVMRALFAAAERDGFDLSLTDGMSHCKAMLVDGQALVVGSSNFDFVSHAAEEEFVAIVTDAGAIGEFERAVLRPVLDISRSAQARPAAPVAWGSELFLRICGLVAQLARNAPRGVADWPGSGPARTARGARSRRLEAEGPLPAEGFD
ncbi:MAG TPA: phosphatidylserine/phosphatidylglycerophosphate/cardiolipin synthase family protein [Caulobacteraceae bacterium]|nr:phosphatidylserine/phosphatidylglycerophosphate/cardiolipin synthase family protein [Caulobacteraceae bacterium]